MRTKFRLGQKVTIHKGRWFGFYAPVNGVIVEVNTSLSKNDLSLSSGIMDYIDRCNKTELYTVAYEQYRGDRGSIDKKKDLIADEIQPGWHGMKCNGDDKEFEKFGLKRVDGQLVGTSNA